MLVNIKVLTGNFTKNDSFCAVELKLKIQMKKTTVVYQMSTFTQAALECVLSLYFITQNRRLQFLSVFNDDLRSVKLKKKTARP